LLLALESLDVDIPPPFVLGGESSQERTTRLVRIENTSPRRFP